jgi:hypothetical protein
MRIAWCAGRMASGIVDGLATVAVEPVADPVLVEGDAGGGAPSAFVLATLKEVGGAGDLVDDALLGADHAQGDGGTFDAEAPADLGIAEPLETKTGDGPFPGGEAVEDANDEFAQDEAIQGMEVPGIVHGVRSLVGSFRPVAVPHWQISFRQR